MKIETIEEISTTFKNTVTKRVQEGGCSRWGGADSLAVIEALVEVLVTNEDAGREGFDAIAKKVLDVINPSAFAQVLEKLPVGNPRRIVREKGTRSDKLRDL